MEGGGQRPRPKKMQQARRERRADKVARWQLFFREVVFDDFSVLHDERDVR